MELGKPNKSNRYVQGHSDEGRCEVAGEIALNVNGECVAELLCDKLVNPAGLGLSPAGQDKCTVIGQISDCDILDASVVRRTIEGPDLDPGISQVCAAAMP